MDRLSPLLKSRYEKMGDTEAGANWCLMALHPSFGPLKLRGIPDPDAFPSVTMDYESVIPIQRPQAGTQAWKAIINVLPHPVQPVSFYTVDLTGAWNVGGVVNPTLVKGALSYSDITYNFTRLCNAYRMMYCGVTVDLDASAATDSGSVVGGQFPLEVQRFNYARPTSPGNNIAYAHILSAAYSSNFPDQSISQLPGAYMGLAKHGAYMPIKLDPYAPWVSTSMVEHIVEATNGVQQPATPVYLRQFSLPTAAPTTGTCFPFYGSAYYGNVTPVPCWSYTDNSANGDIFVPLQQHNLGHLVFYNLNPAANLTIKVRWGVEMRVEPVSTLAPAMQPSAVHDPLAMLAYSDVAGGLPWAYPSEYNEKGKILEVIRKVWSTLRPMISTGLGLIPHPAAQAASAAFAALPSFERPAGTGSVVVAQSPPVMKETRQATATKKTVRRRRRKVAAPLPGRVRVRKS
jgi:hypothetical protein